MAKSKATTTTIPERDLPIDLTAEQAVEAAYADVLAEVASKLHRGLPVLVEADKDLAPFLYMNVRARLKAFGLQSLYLDGRPRAQDAAALNLGFVGSMLAALRDAVRGAVDRKVVVLPHLDLLTTSQGGLTSEAREVIPLLYENPELVWLGFKDPSFPLPRVIENLFPHRASLLGIPRDRLGHLVTQKESRKFGKDFNPWALYKYVSGVNAVRLRRLLSTLEGEDYPGDPKHAYKQLRQATLVGTLELPETDLDREIGGYALVKKRLKAEILDVLAHKEKAGSAEEVARLEELIPRGMIFWGPPGTGKTLFAKAMAASLGAAVTVVSGPELKSRWVGESEDNLRQVFRRARQSAPSIIIFDELDSFASARGMYNGSGVEHSMVNQLLTEMDGFHRDEMVFVVGTTNFVEALDPALLRPGRFEFHLHIPYPEADDRREILEIYNRSMRLEMSPDAIEAAIRATAGQVEGAAAGTLHSGDHINALCRTIARIRLREEIRRETTPEDVDRAINEWIEFPKMTPAEQRTVATHEAGHAVCSLNCLHSPPIDRISIRGNIWGSLGFVRYQDKANRYVVTRDELIDDLCVLMGGREAESLLLDDLSIGSSGDLKWATKIARALVEDFGMGGIEIGVCRFSSDDDKGRLPHLSEDQLKLLDRRIGEILEEARTRAAAILSENRSMVETLRDLLLEHKVIDARTLKTLSKTGEPEIKNG
jgi:cell division protease FtsH